MAAAPTPTPTPAPAPAPAPAPSAATPAPAIQLPQAAPSTPAAQQAVPERPVDFAALFRSFEPPAEERSRTVAAVDITRLPPKPDPRGERPDGPADVSRTPVRGPDTKAAKAAAAKAAEEAKAAQEAKAKAAKAKKAAPSHPSRIWVQVLTGANKDVMDREWRRLVKAAPEDMRRRKPYLSPWRSNFRLLTGPFESEAAAQEFVTKLNKSGVASFQWTSPAGQAVDSLPLK